MILFPLYFSIRSFSKVFINSLLPFFHYSLEFHFAFSIFLFPFPLPATFLSWVFLRSSFFSLTVHLISSVHYEVPLLFPSFKTFIPTLFVVASTAFFKCSKTFFNICTNVSIFHIRPLSFHIYTLLLIIFSLRTFSPFFSNIHFSFSLNSVSTARWSGRRTFLSPPSHRRYPF